VPRRAADEPPSGSSPRRIADLQLTFAARQLVTWKFGLALVALLGWFGGHLAAVSDVAIPLWVIAGLALGLWSPRAGLVVTILVVPYAGGVVDPPQAELLRMVPILGGAARIAWDRLRGDRTDLAPGGVVVGLGFVLIGLYALTAFTAFLGDPNAERLVLAALPWLLGGPIALVAAWLIGAHDGRLPDSPILDAVLVSTLLACLFAFAAWAGVPWTDPFAYPADFYGRLSAFGYPTPTGMAVAIALPFAVVAAYRRHVVLAAVVLAIGLGTVAATGSRGALLALTAGAFVAAAASGRLTPRVAVAGAVIAIVGAVGVLAVRYGATPDPLGGALAQMIGTDTLRAQSWWAAILITVRNPLLGGGWNSLSRFHDFDLGGIGASHNMVLAGFADGGIPLGLAFCAVLFYSILTMWRNRRTIAPYAMAAATTLLVAGLWDIPNLRSYAAVMGGLALGMVARSAPRAVETSRTGARPAGRARRRPRDNQVA
jgi:hypothetical protein